MTRRDDIAREAQLFSRYLVSSSPQPAIVERYRAALAARLPDAQTDLVVRTVRAIPALVGPLDMAAALLAPQHQLRHRLLLLTAILEASPDACEAFLPRPSSVWSAARTLLSVAIATMLNGAVGVPLFLALRLADRPRV